MSEKDTVRALRWVVIIATSYLIIFERGFSLSLSGAAFVAAFIGSNIFIKSLQKKYFGNPVFYTALAVADIIIVTTAIYVFAKPTEDFYVVYFFIIMLSAVGENIKGVLAVTITASLLYTVYLLKTTALDYEFPLRVMFLFVVAIFNSFLIQQLKTERKMKYSIQKDKELLENSMEEEKQKLSEMLMPLAVSLCIVNKERQVIWSNKKETIGETCYSLIEAKNPCKGCLIDGHGEEKAAIIEKPSALSEDKKHILSVTSQLNDGNYICMTQDITEIKHMESRLRFSIKSLYFIYQLLDVLPSKMSSGEFFIRLMDIMEKEFGLEVGTLRILEGDYLILVQSRGIEESMLPGMKKIILGETTSGVAALIKQPVIIRDVELFSSTYGAMAKQIGLECLISIPILIGGKVLGTWTVGSRSPREIDQSHVNLFNAAGNIVGLILRSN